MQEAELHDLSDDSDYAALQEQSFMNNQQTDDGLSVPNGAEVVYLKDNVTIHPTQYASERISGRLHLIKRGSSLFMTWIPYKPSTSGLPCIRQGPSTRPLEKDRDLYTIKAVPLTDVRSIRRHTPTLGWQYIIVVLKSVLGIIQFAQHSERRLAMLPTLLVIPTKREKS